MVRPIFRLQANAVIGRVDKTMSDSDLLTIGDIDAIIIPIGVALHADTIDDQLFTEPVSLYPTTGILHRNPGNTHIFAIRYLKITGPVLRSLSSKIILRAVQFTGIKQAIQVQGQLTPLPVDRSFSGNGNILLPLGKNECQVLIIGWVDASQYCSPLPEL
jgi:hypothetical protein